MADRRAEGNLTGSRIRARRFDIGMRQGDLARRVGISPSYLNLIEHDRRRIGGKLLGAIAEALGTDRASLAEGAEAALAATLHLAAAQAVGDGDPPPELDRIESFVARLPGWAALVARLQDRVAALEETVETLSDRLSHDPFLADTMHEALTAVTAIRATASILVQTADLAPAQRGRFQTNLFQDSRRLAGTVDALVAYLDAPADGAAAGTTPQDALTAFLTDHGNHFPELEAGGGDVDALIAADRRLAGSTAEALARDWLVQWQADARAVPTPALRDAVARVGFDPGAVALRLAAPIQQVLRRLASLPVGAGVPATGLAICDGSGTLLIRKPLPEFPLPRFGAACPLWPLYQALLHPALPVAAVLDIPGGARLSACALAEPVVRSGFGAPQVVHSVMLFFAAPDDPQAGAAPPAIPVGTGCRICSRGDCSARREPALI